MKDYFSIMSDHEFSLTGYVLNPDNNYDGIPDWITLPNTKEYYNLRSMNGFRLAAKNAAVAQGLNVNTNSTTKLVIIYAGHTYRSKPGGGYNGLIPHASGSEYIMGERFAPYGPYYQERPDAIFCGIGIHCHEFGHLLGWPDLYYGSGKNGGWDLMANGNYNPVFTSGTNNKWASAPAPPSPYLRYIKSWINFVSINSDITFSADYNMQDPEIFKIVDSSYPDRHFLIENRNFDATMNFNGTSNFDYNHWLPWNHYLTKPDLPTQGLLIWYCNKYSSDGTYPHLIQADGFNNANHPYNSYILNGPETAGDAGDHFPGFYNVKVISPWSFPTQLDIAPSPSTRQSSNVGCEIIEMGTNYIQVKLFYLNPVNSSPSKPRFLEASSILYPQHGTYITHSTWYSNGEQDLNSYYIYRQLIELPNIVWEDWTLIGTTSGISFDDTSFEYFLSGNTFRLNYKIKAKDNTGLYSTYSDAAHVDHLSPLFPKQAENLPNDNINESMKVLKFDLKDNFPNPFNPKTNISFDLPEDIVVSLEIFDLSGRKIRTLLNEPRTAGTHQVVWNGQDDHGNSVASGLYVYRIQAGDFVQSRKMLFMK